MCSAYVQIFFTYPGLDPWIRILSLRTRIWISRLLTRTIFKNTSLLIKRSYKGKLILLVTKAKIITRVRLRIFNEVTL
jgi:hypothetical protein